MKSTVYVSIDIEALHCVPDPINLLSVGAVAFSADGNEIAGRTWNVNPGARPVSGDSAFEFWEKHPAALEATREAAMDVFAAADSFDGWVAHLNKNHGRVVFVAWPTGYDFSFVYMWLTSAGYRPPFSCVDIKTLAAVYLARFGFDYRKATKRTLAAESPLLDGLTHTHLAEDDAREQGKLFFRLLGALGLNP